MNVSIIGTGYVGLTTGACLAFLGHQGHVRGCRRPKRSKTLERGEIPFYEPYLAELVAEARPNL